MAFGVGDKTWLRKPATSQTQTLCASRKNMRLIYLFGTLVTLFLLVRCGTSDNADNVTQNFLDSLTEKQIGDLNYTISIPRDYSIKENQGPDFSVFHFSPTDTTVKNKFSGGIYFGNYPTKFSSPSDTCKKEIIQGDILDSNADWTVYHCSGTFSIQTIIASKSGQGWNNQIHAFGHGTGKSELSKIQKIYSTLHKKKS